MKKRWKIMLPLVSATATTLPLLSVVSCGETTKNLSSTVDIRELGKMSKEETLDYIKNEVYYYTGALDQLPKNAKQGYFETTINAQFKDSGRHYDKSAVYGSIGSSPLEDITVGKLINQEFTGRAIVKDVEEINPETGETVKHSFTVIPSVKRYKLEQADAIIIIKDGQEIVFDSDEAEVLDIERDVEINLGAYKGMGLKGYSNTVAPLTSNNPRSINSQTFAEALKDATEIRFRLRNFGKSDEEAQYWVDKNGNKTKYKVCARDYWLGILRTALYEVDYRRSHGGTEELDKLAKKLLTTPDKQFENDSKFTNSYVYDLFGVSWDTLRDEAQSISEDGSSLVIKAASSGVSFDEIISNVITSYDFVPAPYEYIQEQVKNGLTKEVVKSNLQTTTEAEVQEIIDAYNSMDPNSLVARSGLYWYGFTLDNTLFSGKYFSKGYNPETQVSTSKLNEHYWDKEYVNDPRTILEFRRKYVIGSLTPAQYADQSLKLYKSGDNAIISFNDLPKQDRADALQMPYTYGITYVQALNKTGFVKDALPTFLPTPWESGHENINFTDQYSYLMYGLSKSEAAQGTQVNPLIKSLNGMAREFQMILLASINWQKAASNNSPANEVYPWLTALAQDAKIKNDADGLPNSLREINSGIISGKLGSEWEFQNLFVLDRHTGERVTLFTDSEGNEHDILKIQDSPTVGVSAEKQYRSIAFDTLQKRMKSLLDEFFEEYDKVAESKGMDTKHEISFIIPYMWVNLSETNRIVGVEIAKVLSELDPRIKVQRWDTTVVKEFWDYWKGTSAYTRVGWGYDFDGIASGFDGYSNSNELLPVIATLAYLDQDTTLDSEARTKLKTSLKGFTSLQKAAELLKAFVNDESSLAKPLSIKPQYWSKFTSHQISNINSTLSNWREAENGELVSLNEEVAKSLGYENFNALKTSLSELSEEARADKIKEFQSAKGELQAKYSGFSIFSAKFWLYVQQQMTKQELVKLANEIININGIMIPVRIATAKSNYSVAISNPSYIMPARDNAIDIDYLSYKIAFPIKK